MGRLHDALRLKPVAGDATRRKYTARASQDIRILLFKEGGVLLLERAGHHDAIYELARRIDVVHNQGTGRITIVDRADENRSALKVPPATSHKSADSAGLFDHWSDAELGDAGFSNEHVQIVRRCATEDELFDCGLDDKGLEQLIDMLGQTPEQWRQPSIDPEAERTDRFRQAILHTGGLAGISPLYSPEEVATIASAPIEDWMIFLHPDQRSAVEASFKGPSRVRGSVGTGKTVVALHRAAALVRTFADEQEGGARKILFTTFIKSLPPVFERLYHRLPGTSDDDDIEFTNIDRLANKICRDAGDKFVINPRQVSSTFSRSFTDVVTSGSPLHSAGVTRKYVQDEISQVIKGRDIRTLEEYLEIERTGRRARFPERVRRQVWELKAEWDRRMRQTGTSDFVDLVIRARDHARQRNAPNYRAAIVDEAQDLTLVGLQLVQALVGAPDAPERSNSLTIVGDGAQRIYPGGFTLRQAGIDVRGRTTVLRTNYRNTREIVSAAIAVAGNATIDDLAESFLRSDDAPAATRSGMKPTLVRCSGFNEEVGFIAEQVQWLVNTGAIGLGDFAVSAATNRQVKALTRELDRAAIPTIGLEDYSGMPVKRVKVGTHYRIKGLEFKVVFLPLLGEADFPRKPSKGQDPDEYDEERALEVSRLFVAMTRARDGLFLLASGEPSPVLSSGLEEFEVVSAPSGQKDSVRDASLGS